jgi:bifunctional non-homologous end joining protein LigD
VSLVYYRAKRNFSNTREPRGGKTAASKNSSFHFVVQKHAASHLHYDFRLEMDGVLKSWAVPKGFPVVKSDKRLAMEVEDHPIEYGGFEGIIPAGNYGAGTVMLWDFGPYESLDDDPLSGWKAGKLSLILAGKKLKGQWHLVRMRHNEDQDRNKNAWLLIKSEKDMKPISARADDKSVKSGKTMKQIAAAADKVWESNRKK